MVPQVCVCAWMRCGRTKDQEQPMWETPPEAGPYLDAEGADTQARGFLRLAVSHMRRSETGTGMSVTGSFTFYMYHLPFSFNVTDHEY